MIPLEYIVVLSGVQIPALLSDSIDSLEKEKQIETSNEFGRDLNNHLLLGHLNQAYPSLVSAIKEINLNNFKQVISECVRDSVWFFLSAYSLVFLIYAME
jgi:hypothetical protein